MLLFWIILGIIGIGAIAGLVREIRSGKSFIDREKELTAELEEMYIAASKDLEEAD